MAKQYKIDIVNGTGTANITNGTYSATATSIGYDSSSLNPSEVTVNTDTNTLEFTMTASGTLSLHVSEEGTSTGTAIDGAVFYRCDSTGTTYGDSVTSDSTGIAVFNNVPYSTSETAPTIYFKQTASDSTHNFDTKIYSVVLNASTYTEEITNPKAATQTVTLKDANYNGLVIDTAEINLSE